MKDKFLIFTFILYIFFFSVLGIVLKDNEISFTERRNLKGFPSFVLDGDYSKDLENYLLDQFPFRDSFRSVKANFNYNVMKKLDNNGVFVKDDYIFKTIYPLDKKSIFNFIEKTNKIKSLFEDSNMYLMIIPDKNYFLEEDVFLNIDYDYIYNEINKLDMITIDITNIMEINDYYKTDTHFKQENLEKIIYEMSKTMDFTYLKQDYIKNEYNNFYGVYYGQVPLNDKGEILTYLTNDVILDVRVKYLENDKLDTIYNVDKLNGLDAYEVYLDGASSFIEIYNENSVTDRNLIIFRDSFGSSLAPLLINYYSKITLIDNRYINSDNFIKKVDKENSDILFVYSTLIVNDSYSLKG